MAPRMGRRLALGHPADDNLIPMRPSSGDRNEVVFAGAMKLEYEKHRRVRADVCYKMRTTRPHGVGLTRGEAYLLLGLLKEDSQAPLKDEERVLHARVVVPRHLLARTDLQLRDSKPRSLGMACRTLGFEVKLRVIAIFHHDFLVGHAARCGLVVTL